MTAVEEELRTGLTREEHEQMVVVDDDHIADNYESARSGSSATTRATACA